MRHGCQNDSRLCMDSSFSANRLPGGASDYGVRRISECRSTRIQIQSVIVTNHNQLQFLIIANALLLLQVCRQMFMMKCRLLFLNKTRSFSGMLTKTICIKVIVIYSLKLCMVQDVCKIVQFRNMLIPIYYNPLKPSSSPMYSSYPPQLSHIHHVIIVFSKVFHVRPVTQGDVIRADAKDIPRIFQVNLNKSNKCTLVKVISNVVLIQSQN